MKLKRLLAMLGALCMLVVMLPQIPSALANATTGNKITPTLVYNHNIHNGHPSQAFDGRLDTHWGACWAWNWGCAYVDLGGYYDLSAIKLVLPENYANFKRFEVGPLAAMPDKDGIESEDRLPYSGEIMVSAETFTTQENVYMVSGRTRYLKVYMEGVANMPLALEIEVYGEASSDPTDANLAGLKIDGIEVEGFDKDTLTYEKTVVANGLVPTVTAVANDSSASVVITPATAVPGTATVKVTSGNGNVVKIYTVEFKAATVDANAQEITLDKIYGIDGGWEGITGATDDKINTKFHSHFDWAGIFVDLGATYDLSLLELDFPEGYFSKAGASIKYKVDIISAIPAGRIEGDGIFETADLSNKDMLGTPSLGIATSGTTASAVSAIMSGRGRYLMIYLSENGTGMLAQLSKLVIKGVPVAEEDNANLSEIKVGDVVISGFQSDKLAYNYYLETGESVPTVSAAVESAGATVNIKQATTVPSAATITVTSKDGTVTKTYTVNFQLKDGELKVEAVYQLDNAWESVLGGFDGKGSTQYHGYNNWAAIYVDLGADYDLSMLEVDFPTGYFTGTSSNVKYSVAVVDGIPGTISDYKILETPELSNQAIMSMTPVAELGEDTVTTNSATILSGTGRYIRIIFDAEATGLNVKFTEIRLRGKRTVSHDMAQLNGITVNGNAIENFDEKTLDYVIELPAGSAVPTIVATAFDTNASVVVKQATSLPGKAVITSTSADGTSVLTYNVFIVVDDGKTGLVSYSKKGVALGNAGIPGYMLDGKVDTAFTVDASKATVFVDLKGLYHITRVQVIFEDGSTGNWKYKMDVLNGMPAYSGKYTEDNGDSLVATTLADFTDGTATGNSFLTVLDEGIDGRYLRLTFGKDGASAVGVKEWRVYGYQVGTDYAALNSITVNGESLDGFRSDVTRYYVDLPFGTTEIPVVAATADPNLEVRVKQASKVNGTAFIEVTSSSTKVTVTYELRFVVLDEGQFIVSKDGKLSASSTAEGSKVEYAADGKIDTAWNSVDSLDETHYLIVDLGDVYAIQRMLHQFYNLRASDEYNIVVDASVDGINYRRVYNSNQDKENGQNVNMVFNAVARYLRVTYYGVSGIYNAPISVSEIAVYGCTFENFIKEVLINGVKFDLFAEDVAEYTYSYRADDGVIPQIEVEVVEGITVTVKQATKQDGIATITVSNGTETRVYTIRLNPIYTTPEALPDEDGSSDSEVVSPDTGETTAVSISVMLLMVALLVMVVTRKRLFAQK